MCIQVMKWHVKTILYIRKDTQTSSGGAKEEKTEHYNSFMGKP